MAPPVDIGLKLKKLFAFLKVVGAAVAIGSLVVAVLTYRTEVARQAETRRVEASRPYLDRQLAIYSELTKVSSFLAVNNDQSKEWQQSQFRFQELYAGEATLVYRGDVENAIAPFFKAISAPAPRSQQQLIQLSQAIARACRAELAASWGTAAWRKGEAGANP